MKTLKVDLFGFFVIFVVNLENFSMRKPQLSLQKAYWTTSFCLVECLQHPNARVELYRKNCIEMLEIKKFWTFCYFWGHFG